MARYHWFILRVWRSGRANGEQWAARLESMPGGSSLRFSDPDDLLTYLAAEIVPLAAAPHADRPDGHGDQSQRDATAENGHRT